MRLVKLNQNKFSFPYIWIANNLGTCHNQACTSQLHLAGRGLEIIEIQKLFKKKQFPDLK